MAKKHSLLRKVLFTFSILIILGIGAVVSYLYLLPPPQVLGENLLLGQVQKIDVSSPLKITFSRWMDQKSVESAFHITPAISGTTRWEGNTMIFEPHGKTWQAEKQYQVWIDNSAQDILRKKLTDTFYQRIDISGPPTIVMNLPQGVVSDDKTPITIVFDRPMVPVTTLAASENFSLPFSVSPAIPGKYKWLSTTTAQFIPDQWLPATTYRVVVSKNFRDMYGLSLKDDFSWQFDTVHPQVLYSYPSSHYEKAGPYTEIIIRFNQAVNQRSLEQNIDWERADTKEKVSFALRLEENGTKAILTPQQSLAYKTQFIATVRKGLKSALGQYALSEDFNLPFTTVGLPVIVSSQPAEGEKNAANFNVTINFSNPMAAEDIDRFIKVEPRIENQLNDLSEYSEHQILSISGSFLPSTPYTITLSQNWQDKYGQKMPFDFVLHYDTAPVPADVAFIGRQDFGLIDGYGPRYEQVLQVINVDKIQATLEKIDISQIWPLLKREPINLASTTGKQTWEIVSPDPLNQVVEIPVDLTTKIKNAGVYIMNITANTKAPLTRHQTFIVSKSALTFKLDPSGGLVWATDLQSGEPVADMNITILKGPNDPLIRGITDQSGLFSFTWPANFSVEENNYYNFPPLLVLGEKNGDLAITGNDYSWNQGIEPWAFNISETSYPEKVRAFITTDRPLYQPGQSVFFKGIYRQEENHDYSLLKPATKVKVRIMNAQNEEIWAKELLTDTFATISDTFTLSSAAPLGNYTIESDINGQKQYVNFLVEQYQKPLFKIAVTTDKVEYVRDETIAVEAQANYYFGLPLAQAKVKYRVTADDFFFNHEPFAFSENIAACFYCNLSGKIGKPWLEKTLTTDVQGRVVFSIPTTFTADKESQLVNIEVGVEDPNTKETIYATKSILVHKGDFYLGVASQKYVVQKKENAIFTILSVSHHHEPRANISGEAALYKREYKTVKKKGLDGFFYYDTSFADTLLKTTSFSTNNEGKSQIAFSIPDAGQYRVVVRASDSKGRFITAASDVWASSETYINWGRDNNDRIEIVPDKMQYSVGETAKLLVKSPYENVKALLSIERNGVIEKQVITLTSTASILEVPLKKEFLPNVFVSLVAIKGHSKDGVPGFKIGYINLRLNTTAKKLDVSLLPDKASYTPKSLVSIDLQVKDPEGKPVIGDFAVAVVDEGLLALSGGRDDDLLERFFGQRSLAVHTYQNLVSLIKRIDVKKAGGAKGGDGGEALNSRKDFKDTAYFNPHIVTSIDGKANIKFTLPDNITTWQVWVFGATDSTLVGSATLPVIAKKDVFIEPILPSFLTMQDQFYVGAVVYNTSDKSSTAKVQLLAENIHLTTNPEQEVVVGANSNKTVSWLVKVGDTPSQAKLNFVLLGTESDSVEKTLPIIAWTTKEAVAFGGVIPTSQVATEHIVLPVGTLHDTIDASIRLSTKLSDTAAPLLTKMRQSPYNSADTLAAKFMITNLKAEPLANSMDILQRLYTYQNSDGGFGYFPGSIQSDPYLSAYILFCLQSRTNQVTLDQYVGNQLKTYLTQYLNAANDTLTPELERSFTSLGRDEANEKLRHVLNTKAYIAFVLSEGGDKTVNIQNLYDRRADLPLISQGYLAMTLQNLTRTAQAKTLISDLQNKIIKSATLAHFEEEKPLLYSNANSLYLNTVMLQLFLRHAETKDTAIIGDLMRYLLHTQAPTTDPFADSSYIWLAYQLDNANKALASNWTIELNGKELAHGNDSSQVTIPVNELKPDGADNVLTIRTAGVTNIYYAGLLQYQRRSESSSPKTQGFSINREYFALEDSEQKNPLRRFVRGQDVLVKMTIIAPHDQNLVILEDNLPAGLRAQNFKFHTTSSWQQQLLDEINNLQLDRSILKEELNPWPWVYQEIKDDKIVMYAENLAKGIYEISYIAKAGVPGNYKVRPGRVFVQHAPDVFATTEAIEFEVTN